MANERTERCDKCRHYFALTESEAKGGPRAGCRRFPPQTHFIVVLRQASQSMVLKGGGPVEPREEQRSTFPPVMPDWWCGEFAPLIALTS